jgi:hypothetical protein
MTEFDLIPHPDYPVRAGISVTVAAERVALNLLQLCYEIRGEVGKLYYPPLGPGVRANELWKTTCFEAFVAPAQGDSYWEFNFSPSLDWAAYEFDGYRSGMQDAPLEPTVAPGPDHLYAAMMLHAEVNFSSAAALEEAHSWRVGLTAVIEARDGTRSYWALAHPPGKPDFHNADCFTARLTAPERA